MDASVLDNACWRGLGGAHAALGVHHPLARRYRREITQIGAVERPGLAAMEALATLTDPGEVIFMAEEELGPLPACWAVEADKPMPQMILTRAADTPAAGIEPIVLGRADAPEMSALAALTHPGPFGPELYRLGLFLGVREAGKLVAMAGQRLRVPGFVEISGVCTHPDWQGRGLARMLMNHLARGIQREGATPFLHVVEANTRAVELYQRMGYTIRKRLWVRVLRRVE